MAQCVKLVEGDVVRLTRVDSCGRPVEGEDNAVVNECWASLAASPNIDSGTDIGPLKNMRGQSCGFRKACPTLLNLDLTGAFWDASAEQVDILTGNPLVFDQAGEPIGWDDCSVACETGFAIEIWQQILSSEACDEGTDGSWYYWLYPHVTNGLIGELTVNSEGLSFPITGSTRAGEGWGLGPWDVMAQDGSNTPGPLLTPLGPDCHRRGFITTIEPPSAVCGWIAVPPNNVS